MIFREIMKVVTKRGDFVDITERVSGIVKSCEIKEGVCHVFVPATTAGIIINENERMLAEDLKRFFRSMADEKSLYNHPSNAFSHIRASLTDKDKTIPVSNGELLLGTWQSIMLWEFDVKDRKRDIIVTIIGETEK